MKKRILSVLLCLVMAVGLLPNTALAGGGIELENNELVFGSVNEGYDAPGYMNIRIINYNSQPVTLTLSGAPDYECQVLPYFVMSNAFAVLQVRPKSGLTANTYNETLTITSNADDSKTVSLKFTVNGSDSGGDAAVKSIMLGTDGIQSPTEVTNDSKKYYEPKSYIYFGVNSGNSDTPIKWRVLDADKDNNGNTGRMFLLSEYLLASSLYFNQNLHSLGNSGDWHKGVAPSDDNHSNCVIANVYQGSDAQTWCSKFADNDNTDNFSTAEQTAMFGVAKIDSSESSLYSVPWGESSLTENDKLFFLSVRELADYVGNYEGAKGLVATDTAKNAGVWWLRSPCADDTYRASRASAVRSDGVCIRGHVQDRFAARPAMNLDKNQVLFTSAAKGGKSSDDAEGTLTKVSAYDGNEWKLTLLDNSLTFTVEGISVNGENSKDSAAVSVKAGDTVKLDYKDAGTGSSNYFSGMIVDSSEEVLYYGRLRTSGYWGSVWDIKIPKDLAAGEYTFKVFREKYNGDYKTDYAGPSYDVKLTVESAGEAQIGEEYYETLEKALTAAAGNNTADTVKIISESVTEVNDATLDAGDSLVTYGGNEYKATTDAKVSIDTQGKVTFTDGEFQLVKGTVTLGDGESITVGSGKKITNPDGSGDDSVTVKADNGEDTVTVPAGNKQVTIGSTTYDGGDNGATFVIDANGNVTLTSGSATLNPGEGVKVGGVSVTNPADSGKDIVVSAETDTVTVPAGNKQVTIGSATYDVGDNGATFVIDANSNVTLTSGSATLNPGEGVKVGGVSVTNPTDSGKDIVVSAEKSTVTVPKGGQANIGEDKITDVGQDMTFTIAEDGTVKFDLSEDETVTINGVKHTGLKSADGKTIAAEEKTTSSIPVDTTISADDKEAINAVIDKAKVQGVTEAVKNKMDTLITNSEIDTNATEVAKIDVDIDVKVELTAADLSADNTKTMTYTATPVATVTTKNSSGIVMDTRTNVAVPNNVLNGEMTVRLPLPAGFEPAQIKHSSSDGSKEYFLRTSARGAKTFTIEGNCAVFTIKKFSTFELSSTKTYVAPSSGGSSSSTTYDVSVDKTENGSVSVSPKNASQGATVTVTVKPDSGYVLGSLTVTDKDGSELKLTQKGENTYTFTMPAGGVNVKASFVKADTWSDCGKDACPIASFTDAQTTAWYHDGVHYCIQNGLMKGYDNGEFGTNDNISRGQIVTILWRLEGSTAISGGSFDDVASDAYYAKAVAWAAENGIVGGYGNGKFGPNDPITREQLAAILYRYAQFKDVDVSVGEDTNILDFDDAQSVSSYAVPAIQWACGSGIITGTSVTTLSPDGTATRAQAAMMLMHYCTEIAK